MEKCLLTYKDVDRWHKDNTKETFVPDCPSMDVDATPHQSKVQLLPIVATATLANTVAKCDDDDNDATEDDAEDDAEDDHDDDAIDDDGDENK